MAEAVATEPAYSPSPAGARQRAPSRLSVLVVDDDALVLMGTALMLEDMGHRIEGTMRVQMGRWWNDYANKGRDWPADVNLFERFTGLMREHKAK